MVRRGDGDNVEVFILKRLADVLQTFRGVASLVVNFFTARFEEALVRIDQVCDLNIFQSQVLVDVGVSLAVNARDADANGIICAEHAAGGLGAGNVKERKCGAGGNRPSEEGSPRDVHNVFIQSNLVCCRYEGVCWLRYCL